MRTKPLPVAMRQKICRRFARGTTLVELAADFWHITGAKQSEIGTMQEVIRALRWALRTPRWNSIERRQKLTLTSGRTA